jgi:hypothetical protein
MRSVLWLACALLLAVAGVPPPAGAQPAPAVPATSTPTENNPGVARLFTTHTAYGLACVSCHDEEPAAKSVPTPVCMSCHGSNDDLADLTDDKGADNPHASHNGPLDCDNCHHAHKPSVNFCQQCHAFDMEVP